MCYIVEKEVIILEILKVCVRIPSSRKEELMGIAKIWRSLDGGADAKSPGWDAKAIHKIAKEHYGGLSEMFEKHHWPETGSDMMRQVQKRVKDVYGTVEQFISKHN